MKKLVSMITTLAMVLSLSCTAFAAEPTVSGSSTKPDISASTSEVSPRSSISGYASGTINRDHPHVTIWPSNASGWGGMGATVKLSCSQTMRLGLTIVEENNRILLDDQTVRTNQENYFNNMFHMSGGYYIFTFLDIPAGVNINYEIWIYG